MPCPSCGHYQFIMQRESKGSPEKLVISPRAVKMLMYNSEEYVFCIGTYLCETNNSYIYLGKRMRTGVLVAIKVPKEIQKGMILNENKVLVAEARTPIVPVLMINSLSARHNMYQITLYCDGGSLDRIIRKLEVDNQDKKQEHKRWFTLNDALSIVKDILEAYEVLHQSFTTHNDIAERNIFFLNGHAVLADFGTSHKYPCLQEFEYNFEQKGNDKSNLVQLILKLLTWKFTETEGELCELRETIIQYLHSIKGLGKTSIIGEDGLLALFQVELVPIGKYPLPDEDISQFNKIVGFLNDEPERISAIMDSDIIILLVQYLCFYPTMHKAYSVHDFIRSQAFYKKQGQDSTKKILDLQKTIEVILGQIAEFFSQLLDPTQASDLNKGLKALTENHEKRYKETLQKYKYSSYRSLRVKLQRHSKQLIQLLVKQSMNSTDACYQYLLNLMKFETLPQKIAHYLHNTDRSKVLDALHNFDLQQGNLSQILADHS